MQGDNGAHCLAESRILSFKSRKGDLGEELQLPNKRAVAEEHNVTKVRGKDIAIK